MHYFKLNYKCKSCGKLPELIIIGWTDYRGRGIISIADIKNYYDKSTKFVFEACPHCLPTLLDEMKILMTLQMGDAPAELFDKRTPVNIPWM